MKENSKAILLIINEIKLITTFIMRFFKKNKLNKIINNIKNKIIVLIFNNYIITLYLNLKIKLIIIKVIKK